MEVDPTSVTQITETPFIQDPPTLTEPMEVDPPHPHSTIITPAPNPSLVGIEGIADSNPTHAPLYPITPSSQGSNTSLAHTVPTTSHIQQPDVDRPPPVPVDSTGNDEPNGPIHRGVRGLLSLTSAPPQEGPFVCLTLDQFRSLEAAAKQQPQDPGRSSDLPQGTHSHEIPGDEGGYDPDDEDLSPRKRRTQSFPQRRVHVRSISTCTPRRIADPPKSYRKHFVIFFVA